MLEAFELGLLGLAPWPLYRALSLPSLRHFFGCFVLAAVVLLGVYAGAVGMAVVYLPAALHVMAAIALAALIWDRLRASKGYGKGRGLPPGSLTLSPRGPWIDHRFYLRKAQEHGPVFKVSLFHRPVICIVGARLGQELMQAHGGRLRPAAVRYNRFIHRGLLRYMEGEDHVRYRRLFQAGFSRQVLERRASEVDCIVRRSLVGLCKASSGPGHQGCDPRAGLADMMLIVLMRLFFGIPDDTDTFRSLRDHYERIDVRKAACWGAGKEIEAASAIARIIEEQAATILARRERQAASPPSFLAEILMHDPNAAFDRTVLLNLVYILQIARVDLTGLLMWIIKKLSDHPEIVSYFHPGSSEGGSACPANLTEYAGAIVKETLRMDQSEFIYRKAGEDIPFHGFVIPKRWLIRICVREGHRDPSIFPEPERFDPHRFIGRSYSAADYSPLGMLGHSCLGAQTVDLVGRTFVMVLAREFDWSVLSDGPREFGAAHWMPSSNFRIELRARSE